MRIPILRAAVLALLLPAASFSQNTGDAAKPQDDIATFRKNVNIVNVFFTVKGPHESLIANLPKEDFEVFENGKPQTIKYFSVERNQPLTLGLLIDSSGSMEHMLSTEKVVAGDFVRQVISQRDLAFVMSFDIRADLLQDLTSDVRLLRSGLDRAHINIGGGSGGIPGLGQGPIPISHPKGTVLFDGVYLAADEILSKQVGRKAMVILTDGQDEGSTLRLRDAIEAAQKADAVCYVLLISDPMYLSNPHDMHELAEQTGGRMIVINRADKIGDAFNQISNELRSEYYIGYSSDNDKRDGTFRKIEVKSKSGHKIQARKGYYAPAS